MTSEVSWKHFGGSSKQKSTVRATFGGEEGGGAYKNEVWATTCKS